jgi:Uma2 family endonuclease
MAVRTTRPAPLTYAQLVRLREKLNDHNRYELINGELEVTPAPTTGHQWVVSMLFGLLWNYVREHQLGIVFTAPLDVILTNVDVVEPDIVYLTAEQVKHLAERAVEEPPTLAVEVLSPSTSRRDRTRKRALYERQGVPHYWIADPRRRTFEAHELRGNHYELVASLTADAEFRTSLFPGLVIPLADLWPLGVAPRRARQRRPLAGENPLSHGRLGAECEPRHAGEVPTVVADERYVVQQRRCRLPRVHPAMGRPARSAWAMTSAHRSHSVSSGQSMANSSR